MRLKSAFWVSALIRRANSAGAFATVLNKGADEAGAIFIVVNMLDGRLSLYSPAPQLQYEDGQPSERLFECRQNQVHADDINQILSKERSFDPDIWVVEIEDKEGRCFIDPDFIVMRSP